MERGLVAANPLRSQHAPGADMEVPHARKRAAEDVWFLITEQPLLHAFLDHHMAIDEQALAPALDGCEERRAHGFHHFPKDVLGSDVHRNTPHHGWIPTALVPARVR